MNLFPMVAGVSVPAAISPYTIALPLVRSYSTGQTRGAFFKMESKKMVKVRITRDCSIKGQHHGAGTIAELSENDAFLLLGMGKAVDYSGPSPEPETKKKAKK